MRLADLVATVYERLDPDAAMADVAAICAYDRYQASVGIVEAAGVVAERAERAGLRDVTVLSFPADGERHWWTLRAPLAWTPRRARLAVGGVAVVRYPEEPYTLAAYSAGVSGSSGSDLRLVRWSAVGEGADPRGAVVVLDTGEPVPVVAARLDGVSVALVANALASRSSGTAARGADLGHAVVGRIEPVTEAGPAVDRADLGHAVVRRIEPVTEAGPAVDRADLGRAVVGRIELGAGTRLAAFSVDGGRLAWLGEAADRGETASVVVDIDARAVPMPVVTGVLPGGADEVLLSAHLCHPRPSANDNASGVAALLAAARVLESLRRDGLGGAGAPTVRFLWGPEFVGTAAYLHDVVHTGRAPVPVAALNVDMAGEDVARCGGPLVIEAGPDDVPSFLPALAGRCAALLPPAHRSYSGAVPIDAWSWRHTPYAGGSDHALLAGEPTRCPAISLGHWPDRVNHSSADTLDTVDPAELRRTASVAAATMAALYGRADARLAADVADATAAWAADHLLSALPGRRPPVALPRDPHGPRHDPGRDPVGDPGRDPGRDSDPAAGPGSVIDPLDDSAGGRRLRHRAEVAVATVAALGVAGVGAAEREGLVAWVSGLAEMVAGRLPAAGCEVALPWDGEVLAGSWVGPVNLRALMGELTAEDRAWCDARLAEDRGGNYARMLALVDAVRPGRTRGDAAWRAALGSGLAVPVAYADRVFDLLRRAGWVNEGGK